LEIKDQNVLCVDATRVGTGKLQKRTLEWPLKELAVQTPDCQRISEGTLAAGVREEETTLSCLYYMLWARVQHILYYFRFGMDPVGDYLWRYWSLIWGPAQFFWVLLSLAFKRDNGTENLLPTSLLCCVSNLKLDPNRKLLQSLLWSLWHGMPSAFSAALERTRCPASNVSLCIWAFSRCIFFSCDPPRKLQFVWLEFGLTIFVRGNASRQCLGCVLDYGFELDFVNENMSSFISRQWNLDSLRSTSTCSQ
jgi:hypothetical protein